MNDFINLPKIMGVINANEDSFFKNSRFEGLNAIVKIENMIENGAQIIDIGGVSSRPGSIAVSAKEELTRVKPIIDLIYEQKLFEKIKFSNKRLNQILSFFLPLTDEEEKEIWDQKKGGAKNKSEEIIYIPEDEKVEDAGYNDMAFKLVQDTGNKIQPNAAV